jgi:cytochrome c5
VGQRILREQKIPIAALFLLPLFLLSASAQQTVPQPQKEKTAAAKTKDDETKTAPADAANYLGMETCKTCHEDIYARLRGKP